MKDIITILIGLLIGFATGTLGFGQVQIMPPERIEVVKAMLPQIDDADLVAILRDDSTLWYDHASLPECYLIGGGRLGNQSPMRPADPMLNASRDGAGTEQSKGNGRGGNANIDFPWKMGPGGTTHSPGVRSVKFQWLPKQQDGKPWPVVYFPSTYEHLFNPSDVTRGIKWIHPAGTIYGEVLIQRLPDGTDVPFEIRVRRREIDAWAVQVFEPYGAPEELATAIKRAAPRWTYDEAIRRTVRVLEDDRKQLPTDVLSKSFPGDDYQRNGQLYTADDQLAVRLVANVDKVPSFDEQLVKTLTYAAAWKDTSNTEWRDGCAMPTASEGPSIKPVRYEGPFLHKTAESCANCHMHTGRSARSFDQDRGWYGVVRGSDEILSWHPFDPAAYVGQVQPGVRQGDDNWIPPLRQAFVKAGIVAQFDPKKHKSDVNDLQHSVYVSLKPR